MLSGEVTVKRWTGVIECSVVAVVAAGSRSIGVFGEPISASLMPCPSLVTMTL